MLKNITLTLAALLLTTAAAAAQYYPQPLPTPRVPDNVFGPPPTTYDRLSNGTVIINTQGQPQRVCDQVGSRMICR